MVRPGGARVERDGDALCWHLGVETSRIAAVLRARLAARRQRAFDLAVRLAHRHGLVDAEAAPRLPRLAEATEASARHDHVQAARLEAQKRRDGDHPRAHVHGETQLARKRLVPGRAAPKVAARRVLPHLCALRLPTSAHLCTPRTRPIDSVERDLHQVGARAQARRLAHARATRRHRAVHERVVVPRGRLRRVRAKLARERRRVAVRVERREARAVHEQHTALRLGRAARGLEARQRGVRVVLVVERRRGGRAVEVLAVERDGHRRCLPCRHSVSVRVLLG